MYACVYACRCVCIDINECCYLLFSHDRTIKLFEELYKKSTNVTSK